MFSRWRDGRTRGAVRDRTAVLSVALIVTFLSLIFGAPSGVRAKDYILPSTGVTLPREHTPPKIKQVLRDASVVHREGNALGQPWGVNVAMSRACSRGLFKQRADRRLIAIFDRRVYGAAVGGHRSLVDRAGLSKAQVIYLFDGQGTTDCRVYHRGQ